MLAKGDLFKKWEREMERLGSRPPRRVQLLITEEELMDVETYLHQRKIYGKSKAIRELIKLGLAVEEANGNWTRPE